MYCIAAGNVLFLLGLLLGKTHERRQWQSRMSRLDQLRRILKKDE